MHAAHKQCTTSHFVSLVLQIPYRTVEVSPLTKKELKWSVYRKVPVAVLPDTDEVLTDSSAIISRLAAELEAQQQRQHPQAQPQHDSQSLKRGWFSRGGSKQSPPAIDSRDSTQPSTTSRAEEMYWRQWVDSRLVKVITVNIYRTAKESFQTFDYIADTGNFTWWEAESARVVGAAMMWGISGRLKKKYDIQGDLREQLYQCADQWVAAVGDRPFMGGDKPNLADLSVFGVVRSITGTDTFMALMHNTSIGRWYERMFAVVGDSSRLPGPAK